MRTAALLPLLVLQGACDEVRLEPFDIAGGVVIADLDGDQLPDLAVALSHFEDGAPRTGSVLVYRQDPQAPGTFLLPVALRVGLDPRELAAADLDGDGLVDLLTSNLGSDSLSVLLQEPLLPGTFRRQVQYATPDDPVAPAVGDFDADGRPDVAVSVFDATAQRRAVAILFQVPAAPGTFAAPALLSLSAHATAVAAHDFDGDLRADLLVGLSPAADARGSVAALRQDPTAPGSFLDLGATAVGFQPVGLAAADLDGDGRADVASADLGPFGDALRAGVSVLRQDPQSPGTFTRSASLSAGVSPRGVAIADLDGDQVPDLAASSPFAVTVWFQDPARRGTFVRGPQLAAIRSTATINGLALGDVDGDGRADIVTGEDESVVVRRQDPAAPGAFLPPVRLSR